MTDTGIPILLVDDDRYMRDLSLIMMDLNHFKKINDTWGKRTP